MDADRNLVYIILREQKRRSTTHPRKLSVPVPYCEGETCRDGNVYHGINTHSRNFVSLSCVVVAACICRCAQIQRHFMHKSFNFGVDIKMGQKDQKPLSRLCTPNPPWDDISLSFSSCFPVLPLLCCSFVVVVVEQNYTDMLYTKLMIKISKEKLLWL